LENDLGERLTTTLDQEELVNLYRYTKGTFLLLHRMMIRAGLVAEQERITIYDLTRKKERVR
jgi:hypothetical protein